VSFDPYAALDVPRNADAPVIRRAYRKAAKKAHPDAGGTAARFAAISRALSVLTDPARRAHYDRTGEAEDKPVDNRAASIAMMLSAALGAVLQGYDQRGRPYETNNIAEDIAAHLISKRRETADLATKMDSHIVNLRKLTPRFKAKNKSERNFMAEIVNGQVMALEQQRCGAKQQIELIDEAVAIVRAHDFERTDRGYTAASPLFSVLAG
jgi:curved DNA-binding protein CbpA